MIYLGFQKSFDKVPHEKLFKKLGFHGTGGEVLLWFEAWLWDKKQKERQNSHFQGREGSTVVVSETGCEAGFIQHFIHNLGRLVRWISPSLWRLAVKQGPNDEGQKGGRYASVQIEVYLVYLSQNHMKLSSKQADSALGKGVLQPPLAGYWNPWLRAQQQSEKQQSTIRKAPGNRTDGTLVPSQRSRENPQLVLCLLADLVPASQRGQRDTGHSNEIFKGWSHYLAWKDQKHWGFLVWREGGVGCSWGLQSHSKLDRELLFTKLCNVGAEEL